MEQDIAAQIVGLGGASDFSLWSLFMRADFVVKFVIVLLIASSIFSWALIFDKFKLFKSINKSTEDFEKKFWKAKSAGSLRWPLERVVSASPRHQSIWGWRLPRQVNELAVSTLISMGRHCHG